MNSKPTLYGYNAAVLHNGTSHDENGNGNVWLMAARYAVAAAVHGVPMVYMSQPLGVPGKIDFQASWQNMKGYWDQARPDVARMYRRINLSREQNPALRSTNRYFLQKQTGGGFNESMFSVARWSGQNIVLAFINLRDRQIDSEVFAIPNDVPIAQSQGVRYQAYNLLADDPKAPLWPQPQSEPISIETASLSGSVTRMKLNTSLKPVPSTVTSLESGDVSEEGKRSLQSAPDQSNLAVGLTGDRRGQAGGMSARRVNCSSFGDSNGSWTGQAMAIDGSFQTTPASSCGS